jgi:hypothetical protein
MKYDGEKNVWTVVAFLPQYARFLNCVAQFGDWIFVSGGHFRKIVTYLFNPSTREWLVVGKTVLCSYLKLFVSCMAAIWRCTEFSE